MSGTTWAQRIFGTGRYDVEAAVRASLANLIPLLILFAMDRLDLAVFASFGAFTALYGRSEPYRLRVRTLGVAAVSFAVVMTAAILVAASGSDPWATALVLVAVVVATISLSEVMSWVPRGALFFVFALLVPASIPIDPTLLWEPLLVMALSITFAVALGVSGWLIRRAAPEWAGARFAHLSRRPQPTLAPLRTSTHTVLVTVNVIGILAAWAIPLALGVGHSYWAAVTVAAVLPTIASLTRYDRMLQRLIGTVLGVLVAAALYLWEPPDLVVILIITACALAAELFVGRNYGLALLFITPLALGAGNLSRHLAWPPLLRDRIIETVLGAAVALVIIVAARLVVKHADRPSSSAA